jgi:cysteine desulfurase / selenocysteine lyase
MTFNVETIRNNFPCLHQTVNGQPLAFLDTAASAQKPQAVIDAIVQSYSKEYANVHRGLYYLSDIATRKFEDVRGKAASFLNAASPDEIIFTKGATEAINLVAASYGNNFIRKGQEIIISALEHHANIVPWQQICTVTGAVLRVAPITDTGELDLAAYSKLLSKNTALVAITAMSNTLGTITPIAEIISKAHAVGAKVLVDASQAIVHFPINVQTMNCDFLVFSAHKLYGPNGVGVLYGKYALLESMPPYQTGGEMIEHVTFEETTFQLPPLRFEAGTPGISEVIAFGAALDYLNSIDLAAARKAEHALLEQTTKDIIALGGFTIIGTATHKTGAISFIHHTAHANDIGAILYRCGVAIRAGHHCTEPLMKQLGLSATARASFGIYTNQADCEALLKALTKINHLFGRN